MAELRAKIKKHRGLICFFSLAIFFGFCLAKFNEFAKGYVSGTLFLLSIVVPPFLLAYKWSAKARKVEKWIGSALNVSGMLIAFVLCQWNSDEWVWALLMPFLYVARCVVHCLCIDEVNELVMLEKGTGAQKATQSAGSV